MQSEPNADPKLQAKCGLLWDKDRHSLVLDLDSDTAW
jgi:hypothetical protein